MSTPETTEAVDHGGDSKRNEDDVWSSRPAFYFAAVGAAVGFGNVWRFPALSVEYGGGAFFIPYFLAFFIIGVPILILEIGFGQFWQTGDVGVFGSFNPRLRGVGVASVACGWMLVVYYSVLIAWVINAFFDSFGDAAPWADEGVNGDIAIDYFLEEIIGTKTLGEDQKATRMMWINVGYSALAWACIWGCLAFGTKVTGRIAYFTMGIPFIVLIAFLIQSLTLTGASDGVAIYIGEWDVSVLTERGDVWAAATTQIFFSLGITFGIMTAFGSHCKRHEPVFVNCCVIATANTFFSIISGFAVFAALGHLAHLEGVEVDDLNFGGFSLVFGTWPVVLGTMPGGIHWVRLLFFDLFLLGLDSAFAFLEGILTVTSDTEYFKDTPKWKMSGGYCLISFFLSIMYCTDAGLNWLDAIDYYINFVMTLVGFFETFGAGWIYGIDDQIKSVGAKAVYSWMILANFFPTVLACALWFGMEDPDAAPLAGFLALLISALIGVAVTAFFLNQRMQEEPGKWTWRSIWFEATFSNIFALKDRVEPTIQYIPNIWAYLIKGVIPQILIVVFISAAATKVDGTNVFWHYGNYPAMPYQFMGVVCIVFALALFVAGFFFPGMYAFLATAFEDQHHEEVKEVKVVADSDEKEVKDEGSVDNIKAA